MRNYTATTLRHRRDQWIADHEGQSIRSNGSSRKRRSNHRPRAFGHSSELLHHREPCGGERSDKSQVDKSTRGIKHSVLVDAEGIPLGAIVAPANRHDSPASV